MEFRPINFTRPDWNAYRQNKQSESLWKGFADLANTSVGAVNTLSDAYDKEQASKEAQRQQAFENKMRLDEKEFEHKKYEKDIADEIAKGIKEREELEREYDYKNGVLTTFSNTLSPKEKAAMQFDIANIAARLGKVYTTDMPKATPNATTETTADGRWKSTDYDNKSVNDQKAEDREHENALIIAQQAIDRHDVNKPEQYITVNVKGKYNDDGSKKKKSVLNPEYEKWEQEHKDLVQKLENLKNGVK